MDRGLVTTALFVALVGTACTAASADVTSTSEAEAVTDVASAPDPAGAGATTLPAATAGDPPGTTATTATTAVSSPPTSFTAPATTAPVPSPLPVPVSVPVEDEVAGDEPLFEVEPLRPLDLDAVVVAIDDAGIGGVPPDSAPPRTGWAGFDAALESELLRNGNTAFSVAVSIGGDVVHAAAFGGRSFDPDDRAEPVDRFRIASISKVFTAITLLQLVEDDVVGLDEPVGDIVARHLGLGDTAAGVGAITVRQLLDHTAGFGKYHGVFFRGQAVDCIDAARAGLRRSLSSSPGSTYRYSNMNYCVAGLLVEALTGRSYEAVVYERLLTPLGLSGLRLAPTVDPGPDEILHPTTFGRNYMETLGASGSWVATPTDLVTVLDSLDLSTPGWKPLESDTLVAMQTSPNGQWGQRGYGMGLILYGPGRYGHTGTIESTHAMVMNRGDGVIWAITVSGPHPSSTPRLESIINRAFEAGGFVAG